MADGTGDVWPVACARWGAERLQHSSTTRTAHHRTTSVPANVDGQLPLRVPLS